MKPLCIYHGNCQDGFAAAWCVWMALGHEVDLHPGVYQEPPPDVADRDVIIVDFSYKRPVFEEMAAKATSLLVLDHHKTAAEDLQGFRSPFGNGWPRHLDNIYQDMCEGCGGVPYALFDMDRSGAGLAWDFFFKAPRPKLIDHIEDRDLWRFALPKTREIAAAVFSYPYDLDLWSGLMADEGSILARLAIEGEAIERKHHQDIANLLPVVQREMVLGGMRMPVACLPLTFTSDAGHTMAVAADGVAACYWDTPAGRVFSLRSTDSGPDVSLIAKKYGGGGHHHAAGFRAAIGWEGE